VGASAPDLEFWGAVLSPDSRLLAVIDRAQHFATLWYRRLECRGWQEGKTLGRHWNQIRQAAFSADGRKLATVGEVADVVKIWSPRRRSPEVNSVKSRSFTPLLRSQS
jgi:WD40 repeat protein